jgi:hypothetical protein
VSILRLKLGAGARLPAGSRRNARLDPRTLPISFSADDASADGRTRTIVIDRHRVLLSRTVRGVYMRLNLPLASFLGVAVRLLPPSGEQDGAVAIMLEHRDANLSVPLCVAEETDHLIADWQLWGRTLGKKLLVAEDDGTLREPFDTLGLLTLGRVGERRERRTALRTRRPKMFRRRACTRAMDEMTVHRGEREIIAPE